MQNKTSIIILTYNNLDYTKECIKSIKKYTEKDTYEIIVIDNFSTDDTRKWLKTQKNIKIILNEENLGFPKGCNQGIKIANKNNDILLLNNDTIVTKNWLKNLKTCLHSNNNIGAAGAVCNHSENLQGLDIKYNDFNEMQILAEKNNISNSEKWEEKAFLIGFCLLIKREVINKIKSLDEEYSPGYVEDNDLSLRIIKLGYKLMLCHDCFIHHYLGTEFRKDLNKFYPILNKNRTYFEKKWGFSSFAFDELKEASIQLLEKPVNILDINCGIGITILKIKYKFRNVHIDAIEPNKNKSNVAKNFATVYKSISELKQNNYDYILIGNILEDIKEPENFINEIKKYLKDDGFIIGEISNTASIDNIKQLLEDKWYQSHKNKQNYFTIGDIYNLFYKQNYKNGFMLYWYKELNAEEEKINNVIKQFSSNDHNITYYSFKFQK